MKGYKGFSKGLICRGKQYAENTVFEEEEAVVCKLGMHFCKDPIDVLRYYPMFDDNGDINEFAEVEALEEPVTDNGKKFCTKKLKIGARISFTQLVQASVNFEYEKISDKETEIKITSNNFARIDSSGYSAKIGSQGDYAHIGSSGDCAQISTSGNYACIGSYGYSAKIGSSGYAAKIGSQGDYAHIGSSGDCAQISTSGNCAQISTSGNYAQISMSGNYAQISVSGNYAKISASGYSAKIGSSGDYVHIGSSGDYAQICSSGYFAVICCAGHESKVKAKKCSWITLSEWKYDEGKKATVPVCVKTEQVDGERIKEDTYYMLVDGQFTEVHG